MVKPSQTVVVEFPTSKFSSGALTDATGTPTGTFSRNGTDDGAVTVTVTNISTGRYKASFAIPEDASAGDSVNLWIAATVDAVAGGNTVWHDQVDTKRFADLNDIAAADVDAVLTAAHGAGSWQTGAGNSGTGARTVTVTVDDGTDPIEGAKVRFTKGGDTFTATTDATGLTTFGLDDGTYTLAVTAAGFAYTPTTQVIAADAALTVSMSAVSIPAAADPAQSNAYLTTYDAQGNLAPNITVEFRLLAPPPDWTGSCSTKSFTATSDANSLLQVTLMRLAEYRANRGPGQIVRFTVTDTDTYALPVILGQE